MAREAAAIAFGDALEAWLQLGTPVLTDFLGASEGSFVLTVASCKLTIEVGLGTTNLESSGSLTSVSEIRLAHVERQFYRVGQLTVGLLETSDSIEVLVGALFWLSFWHCRLHETMA